MADFIIALCVVGVVFVILRIAWLYEVVKRHRRELDEDYDWYNEEDFRL